MCILLSWLNCSVVLASKMFSWLQHNLISFLHRWFKILCWSFNNLTVVFWKISMRIVLVCFHFSISIFVCPSIHQYVLTKNNFTSFFIIDFECHYNSIRHEFEIKIRGRPYVRFLWSLTTFIQLLTIWHIITSIDHPCHIQQTKGNNINIFSSPD